MTTATLGIDPAKSVFALHGADAAGKPVLVCPNLISPIPQLAKFVARRRAGSGQGLQAIIA